MMYWDKETGTKDALKRWITNIFHVQKQKELIIVLFVGVKETEASGQISGTNILGHLPRKLTLEEELLGERHVEDQGVVF